VGQVEVSAADIARIAGVRPSAVSNWRRRHEDFPSPVNGSDRNPRFELAAVEKWLRRQGKAAEVSPDERLWHAFELARGAMPTSRALVSAGLLLTYLQRRPGATPPGDEAGLQRVLSEAEHALAFGHGTQAAGVIGLRGRASLGQRGVTMLHAVADASSGDDPARVFEYLCARVFEEGARTGIPVTPPELAELMLDLAASPVPGDRAGGQAYGTASGKTRLLLDPACGSGTILLAAARRGWGRVEGQEQDSSLALITAIRLAFQRDAPPDGAAFSFDVHAGDSIRRDAYPRQAAQAVVCNPPFADRNWGADDLADDDRWVYGIPPRAEPELAWAQHALAHTATGGLAVVLMPPGAASRPSGRRLRANLVRQGALRAVISLPPRLAAHYALALQVWVFSRPEPGRVRSHVLLVDAAGLSARMGAASRAAEADPPSWNEIRSSVLDAWTAFNDAPDRVPAAGEAAIAVPVDGLLDEDVDLTPGRHMRRPQAAAVSQEMLSDRLGHMARRLQELARLLPEEPEPSVPSLAFPLREPLDGVREVSLEELAQRSTTLIRRGAPRASGRKASGPEPRVEGRILLGQDLARAVPPSATGEVIADELRNPAIREGDVLVPAVARRLTARVAAGKDVGAYLSPTVYLIRPDTSILDPWFLAGFLSSSDGGLQAARLAATVSDHFRFEPRKVRIPLIPIEAQRAYGESFRRLWDFARTLRATHDEGVGLVRDLVDALAAPLSGAQDHPVPSRPAPAP
jgi:type I restriction-modification system DNA methylase subunit/transposase-like protein